MYRETIIIITMGVCFACTTEPSATPPVSASDVGMPDSGVFEPEVRVSMDLPIRHIPDEDSAERGRGVLLDAPLGPGLAPRLAMDSLWAVWGTGRLTGDAYWAAFRDRYGFHEAPYDNGGLPMGMRAVGGQVAFDCLMCHGSVVAGVSVIGAGNSTLDLQGLFDDLVRLAALAERLGYPPFEIPYDIEGRTGAAGANDAMGLGFALGSLYRPSDPPINTDFGFQRARSWWAIKHKDRLYADGAGHTGDYRTMMATLLAFGMPFSEFLAREDDFADLQAYLLTLEAPDWPFEAPEPDAQSRGRAVFDAHCAGCHGTHSGPEARFPDLIVDVDDVGTDPVRAQAFGAAEEDWVNTRFLGSQAMEATGGYLAPPLVGIWASAPYLHNGSVPDVVGVIDSAQRPERWRRTGSGRDDYDPDKIGWRYVVESGPSADSIEGRRVYDTTRRGLGNGGHLYGDDLGEGERADLLAYLKGL